MCCWLRTALIAALFCVPHVVFGAVDINTAGVGALTGLTGIGSVKAQAIVDYRDTNGPFATASDIQNVSGIGPATYASITDDITVSSTKTDGSDDGDTDTDDEESASETNEANETAADESGNRPERTPIEAIIIDAPKEVFSGRPITFSAAPKQGTRDRLVRYRWSFGDGTVGNSRSELHTYHHPGTYVVTVTARYAGETRSARMKIKVVPMQLSLDRTVSGIEITNHAATEIDLGNLRLVGEKTFTFPRYTIVLPGETLVFPASVANATAEQPVRLLDESGRTLAIDRRAAQSEPVRTTQPVRTPAPALSDAASAKTTASTSTPSSAAATSTDMSAAAAASDTGIPSHAFPYLGLSGLLALGVLAVYASRVRSVTSDPEQTFT